jgi:hypothetical protein
MAADGSPGPAGPQSLADPAAGLLYADGLIEALRAASMRVAMVERGGQPVGTALLAGPDLLLTAAHVLGAAALPPPVENLTAVFDFRPVAGASPAETGIRIRVAGYLTGSLPSDSEAAARHLDWEAPQDRLDFALLRLAFPLPDAAERGHFRLEPAEHEFLGTAVLYVFQHPFGVPQMVSVTAGARRNASGTRVRYKANTLSGSSGSAVIDVRGRLVALHHYSAGNENQGVPLSRIARAVAASGHKDLLPPSPARPGAAGTAPAPGGWRRLELLGRYAEAAEMRLAYAAAGDRDAAQDHARRLRAAGRPADAALIEDALARGRAAIRDAVARARSAG